MTISAVSSTQVEHGQSHTVVVHVNEQPVEIPAPNATGLEIKQAAVNAQLPVQVDFVLSEERHNGDARIVGDTDVVTVNKESRFLLVPPDDNS
jgi:hypothetical protein